VKTAVARRNYVNGVDSSDGTVDRLRTFDDYSGSPSQHTGAGWDNVTGLGTPTGIFHPVGSGLRIHRELEERPPAPPGASHVPSAAGASRVPERRRAVRSVTT